MNFKMKCESVFKNTVRFVASEVKTSGQCDITVPDKDIDQFEQGTVYTFSIKAAKQDTPEEEKTGDEKAKETMTKGPKVMGVTPPKEPEPVKK